MLQVQTEGVGKIDSAWLFRQNFTTFLEFKIAISFTIMAFDLAPIQLMGTSAWWLTLMSLSAIISSVADPGGAEGAMALQALYK